MEAAVKFWVGWEKPQVVIRVEIVQVDLPTSSTCFQLLCLPCHYTTVKQFQSSVALQQMIMNLD